jgi:peptidoglycan lytic transglycosylase
MRFSRWIALVLLAVAGLFPLVRHQRGARAEAEGPPASPAAPAPPAPPVATSAIVVKSTPLDGVRFDPATVRLRESSVEQQMRVALGLKDTTRARALGEAALQSADALSRGRLLWLLAAADVAEEAPPDHLAALAQLEHPLARWAALRLGETVVAHEAQRAVALAEGLQHHWAGVGRARLLLALAQHKAGNDRAAEPLYRTQLERVSDRTPAVNIAFPLAEILIARGDRKSLEEALALYRRVGARAVATESGDKADKFAKQLLARMAPKDRTRLALPSVEDEMARGDELVRNHKYDDAIALYDKLAKRLRGDHDKDARCKPELEAGHALFMKRDREEAQKRLSVIARRCSAPEIKAWAHYYAASARQRTNDPKGAIVEYEALVHDTPEHSLADDALYLEAGAQADAGNAEASRKVLERMLERYPHGDMRAEARFGLAFAARARGDHAEALAQLEKLLAEGPAERNEAQEGRAAYWRARSLQDLGRLLEAKQAYMELAHQLPLAYHAQQAIARVSELDPAAGADLRGELTDAAPESSLTFAWRPELDSAAFKTAIELLRVGESDLAQQELGWLGATGESADRDMLWLVAAMLHEGDAHADAAQLVRSRLKTFRTVAPIGRARLMWRIAYPHAFSPLIEQAAAESQVPADFVRAVAREESGFNPESVSTALAYGLIQVIRPTAKPHARALGLPSDPDSLKRPDVNLRIGSHFIRELWTRYAQNPAIVPAAYNAGYFATDRWLQSSGNLALDEWIERIPYRETRRYTRRVLQSYGIYAWLDSGRLPPLPARLPAAPAPAANINPNAIASDSNAAPAPEE